MDTTPPTGQTTESAAATCRYPGCESAPVAADSGRPGVRPAYCSNEAHNASTAFRERRRQRASDEGRPVPVADDLDRPVTMSQARGAELLRGAESLAGRLGEHVTRLIAELQILTDPDAAEAEVAAVRAAAAEQVAAAEARAAHAERLAQAAQVDAAHAREDADEAGAAAEEALRRADQAEARALHATQDLETERAAMRAELERIRAAAAEQVDAAEAERDRLVAEAERQAAINVERVRAEAAGLVDATLVERDRAAIAAQEAEQRAARAEQQALDARAEIQRARADADRERQDLTAAYDGQVTALTTVADDARVRATRAELDVDAERAERQRLALLVDQLRGKLDQLRAEASDQDAD